MNLAFGTTDLINVALEVATEAHKGQTRWDKSPYINHPIRVAEIANFNCREEFGAQTFDYQDLIITCLVHDLAEDVQIYVDKENLIIDEIEERYNAILKEHGKIKHVFNIDKRYFVSNLKKLNKHYYKNYLDFILAAKSSYISKAVKIADLTHNLSDLTKGSMKEKYQLALYILEH